MVDLLSSALEGRPERAFAEAVGIMARLRGPDGCPWDREQNFDSIRKHTIEEAYEVLDAIERRDWANLTEELGDLLLQVLFYAQMAADEGLFTIADVIETLNRKLIRRHPHVFGEAASSAAGNLAIVDEVVNGSSERVLANWEAIKKAEKSLLADAGPGLLLDSVQRAQRAQPALAEAQKLGSKAAKVGFDWPDWRGLLAKVDEETAELVEAVEGLEKQVPFGNDSPKNDSRSYSDVQISSGNDNQKGNARDKGNARGDSEVQAAVGDAEREGVGDGFAGGSREAVESELGDLLFTVVNLGRHLGVDAEMALRGTNARFRKRFGWMEQAAGERALGEHSAPELEALWADAKTALADEGAGSLGAGR